MPFEARRLLIVACSQRKRSDTGLLPAVTRYDGVTFRVLRKAKREGYWCEKLDVLILSAKYGLITASTPIAYYEQRMNRKRAKELEGQATRILQSYSQQFVYSEVYVDLGQDYQLAVQGLAQLFKASRVIYADGRIGERLKFLKNWLVVKFEG